ncbi:hypothetical protein CBW65_20685 [Tumebacillus avium]|uniref:HTH cro/C1-type domain-containing protein n=1 Tax=Tumebacillus avium TaxID=1903704 RepID=A0A1Y0ITL3_9BACL|nr:tetratricopeptide repeat protein [Tumebacillus avium]ARU63126.1 hypothetical protein CBW65_20685 [Tumebacillus avium]
MAEQDYNVWLGKRIREIMAEKKVKVRGFAKEIDLGRMTLERILDGRYATAEELEKIAGGLGIAVERLKRTDVADLEKEYADQLDNNQLGQRGVQIAEQLAEAAIGRTEKRDALTKLGTAHYLLRNLDLAQDLWERAYLLIKDTADHDLLFRTINNLLVIYLERHNYMALQALLDEVEPIFGEEELYPHGVIAHCRGQIASLARDYTLTRTHFLKSLDSYRQIGHDAGVGRVLNNLGSDEYLQGNYEAAISYLEEAREYWLKDSLHLRAVGLKQLAQAYLKAGRRAEALGIADELLPAVSKLDAEQPGVWGVRVLDLMMIRAEVNGDIRPVVTYLGNADAPELRCMIADRLTDFYLQKGDSQQALVYYRIVKASLPAESNDFKRERWFSHF